MTQVYRHTVARFIRIVRRAGWLAAVTISGSRLRWSRSKCLGRCFMAGQEQVGRRRREEDNDDGPPPVVPGASRDAEVDALLDEIDDVLEQNAEQFVRGFVQKGGQ